MSRADGLPRWRRVRKALVLGRPGDAVYAVVGRHRDQLGEPTGKWYGRAWLNPRGSFVSEFGLSDVNVDERDNEGFAKNDLVALILAARAGAP